MKKDTTAEQKLLGRLKTIQQKLSMFPSVEQLIDIVALQSSMLALERRRLDWLDKNCSFCADHKYEIGPFKPGGLRRLADAGLEVDDKEAAS